LLALAGCAGKTGTGDFPYQQLEESGKGREAMAGTILLTRTAEGRSVTAPGVLLVQWPDKLRLELQDPVGSLLGLLVVNGGRFFLYQHDRKENLTGPLSRLPGSAFGQLGQEDLARIFLARPELEGFRGATVTGGKASATVEGARQTLSWSGRHLLEEWTQQSPEGPFSSAQFDSYEFREGALYPTRVRLRRSGGGLPEESMLIAWREWEPAVSRQKNLFEIPVEQRFGRPTKALR
jgi:outer membrane lipoprotein-sorting protein